MLDPTDHELIKQAADAGAVLVTWDRVMRAEPGVVSPYEAMDKALEESTASSEDLKEVDRLRQLSPRELTSLTEDANKTYELFRQQIAIPEEVAVLIRHLRVNRDYSWRAIARFCSDNWEGAWESNQLAGMVICEKAARMSEEDFMEPPWN